MTDLPEGITETHLTDTEMDDEGTITQAHADLASALMVTHAAAVSLALEHDPGPSQALLAHADAVGWAALILLAHAIEYGTDRALTEALTSLSEQVAA